MKRKVLKEIRSLYPPENLIDITDQYWKGYKDAVSDAVSLIKKLDLHSVSNNEMAVCDALYHKHVCLSSMKYLYCPHCGKPLSQTDC